MQSQPASGASVPPAVRGPVLTPAEQGHGRTLVRGPPHAAGCPGLSASAGGLEYCAAPVATS